jgi:hypothetical protein
LITDDQELIAILEILGGCLATSPDERLTINDLVHLLRAMLGKLNLDLEKVQKDLTAIFE